MISIPLAITKVSSALLDEGVKKATLYLDIDFVVKATRGQKPRKNTRSQSFVVTYGKPNYQERIFINLCIRAGEPIPVKSVQLKFFKS